MTKTELNQTQRVQKTMLTLSELIAYTGYTKRYVYHLTSERRIPYYKPAGKLFFDKIEIDNWLHQNKVRTKTELSEVANGYNNF